MLCKYFCCNKNCQKEFDEKLKKKFVNTYKFNHLTILTVSLFRYCENMDDWENLNETLLHKEDFYSHLNREDITP